MADLLAWVVSQVDVLPDEDTAGVVFARSEARARVKWARAEGLDPRGVKARREPKLDAHAPGPVSMGVLLEMGWHFECSNCYHEVDAEGCLRCAERVEEETGRDAEFVAPVAHGQNVWCSEECRVSEQRARAKRESIKEAARSAALLVLPSAVPEGVWPDSDGGAVVELRVPGCKGRVRYEWPAERIAAWVSDHPALLAAMRRPALETWESEGGAARG